jgi:hypothetical protein
MPRRQIPKIGGDTPVKVNSKIQPKNSKEIPNTKKANSKKLLQ